MSRTNATDNDGKTDEDDLDGLDNEGDWVMTLHDVGSDGITDSLKTGCTGGYNSLTNPDPAFDNYETPGVDECHPDNSGNLRRKNDPDLYTEKNGIPDHGSTPLGLRLLNSSRRPDSLRYFFRRHDFINAQGPGTSDSLLYLRMSGGTPLPLDVTTCQSPTNTSDTRFFFSFGPFGRFSPGDTLNMSVAFVSGYGVDVGPNNLKENAINAMALYQRDHNLPVAPPSPALKITTEKHRTLLEWGSAVGAPDPLESFDGYNEFLESLPDTHWRVRNNPDPLRRGGRGFEGFKVWRSTSPTFDSTSFSLLDQYDVDDDLNYGYQPGLKFSYVDSAVRTGNEYWYTVASYSIPTIGSFMIPTEGGVRRTDYTLDPVESPLRENAQHVRLNFGPSTVRGDVMVVPNPYRSDVSYTDGDGFEGPGRLWNGYQRAIKFINLPERATVRIFTVAGNVITTIKHDDIDGTSPIGEELWKLFSESGRPITGGIYVYSVESELGTHIGKFVILK
jgi:hypothetical protein